MKFRFLNIVLGVLLVGFMAGCGSDSDSDSGSGGSAGGISTCISLNSLSTPSTIASKNGGFDLMIVLGSEDASVQHIAGNDLVWQYQLYRYSLSGNTISFTRDNGLIEQSYINGMNPEGAVVPLSMTMTLSNDIVRAGETITYNGVEYTVQTASDNNIRFTCN